MDRAEILAATLELKLFGMKSDLDEVITTAVRRVSHLGTAVADYHHHRGVILIGCTQAARLAMASLLAHMHEPFVTVLRRPASRAGAPTAESCRSRAP
jgi:hypothetical protein